MSLRLHPHLLLCIVLPLLFIPVYAAAHPAPQTSAIVINEILPWPTASGIEWVELYNAGSGPIDVTGWYINDEDSDIPPTLIDNQSVISGGDPSDVQPGAFLVIQLDAEMLDTGYDHVKLFANDNTIIDTIAYNDALPGHSYARMPDAGATWDWQNPPTQGKPNDGSPLTPTPDVTNTATATATTVPADTATATATATTVPADTATATATGTATTVPADTATATATGTASGRVASVSLVINEILPMQSANNAGWIELYNPADTPVNITNQWHIRHVTSGGNPQTHALQDQVVPASGFIVYYFAPHFLSTDGAALQLYDAQGDPVGEKIDYPALSADQVYARVTDGAADWRSDYPASPGGPNLAPTPTSTATSTPSATSTPEPQLLFINEVLPAPDTEAAEWVEFYNPAGQPIHLAGWTLRRTSGDVQRQHVLTDTTILAGGFAVQEMPSGFLPNSGATLELFDAQGRLIGQAVTYPALGNNQVYARATDGAAEWRSDYPPSPGGPNLAPTPTITTTPTETTMPTSTPTATLPPDATPEPHMLLINEILPAPEAELTEWVELYNPETSATSTDGWTLRRTSSSNVVRIQTLAAINVSAGGFAVQELPSGFLPNSGATLELFDAQGRLIGQAVTYPALGKDQGYSRTSDGATTWSKDYPLSRGASNQPPDATATPTRTPSSSSATSSTTRTPTPTPARTATPTRTPSVGSSATPTADTISTATSMATMSPVATQAASRVQGRSDDEQTATPLAEASATVTAAAQETVPSPALSPAAEDNPTPGATSTTAPVVAQVSAAPSATATPAAVPAAAHGSSGPTGTSLLDTASTYIGNTGWLYADNEKGSPYRYQPAAMLEALAPRTVHAAQTESEPPTLTPAPASSGRRQIGLLAGLLLVGLACGGLWLRYHRS